MNIWLIIGLVAFVTFLERASFILILSNWDMPAWFVNALRFVPVAVFPALVAPLFLMTDGAFDISLTSPKIIGGLVATIVAWRSKHLLATITVGMLAFWGASYLFG